MNTLQPNKPAFQPRYRFNRSRWLAGIIVLLCLDVGIKTQAYAFDISSGSTYQVTAVPSSATFKGGTLQLNTTSPVTDNFALGDYSTNTIDAIGNTVTMSGTFTGTGGMTFIDSVGGGNVILSNSGNTYTGVTVVNSGAMLSLSGTGALASSSDINNNGTFDISQTTSGASIISLDGSGTINLGAQTLTLTNANGTFSGSITGTGGVTIAGGTEILAGNDNYTGSTAIAASSTLQLSGSLASNIVDSGTLEFVGANNSSYGGIISGKGTVVQGGTGTITLTGANTYTGVTTVGAGTLALSGSGNIGSSSSVAANGIFDISATSGSSIESLSGTGTVQLGSETLTITNGTTTFSGVIAGSGGLTVTGGVQVFTGTNTYTGATTITGGALEFGSSSVTYSVADSGTVGFDSSSAISMTGVVSGSGGLSQLGSGVTTISVPQSYTGPTTISVGTLALSGTGSIAASSGVTVAGVFDISATGGTSVASLSGAGEVQLGAQSLTLTGGTGNFSGIIEGTGGLIIAGANQTLSGQTGITGATTISSGTLFLTFPSSLSASSDVTDDATLDISQETGSAGVLVISLAGSGAVNLGSKTLVLTSANDTFSGVISGSGIFSISAGAEILTGANSYTGNTQILGGILALSGGGSISASASVIDNGTFDISATGGTSVRSLAGSGGVNLGAQTLTISNAMDTFSGTISGSGGLVLDTGTEILSGANSYTGGTLINDGTLQIGGSGSITGNVTNYGTLAFSGTNSTVFSGVISGTGGVAQLGSGTTILTATNAYTGGTTISAGTLQIGNGTAAGSIQGGVLDNGTLAFGRSDDITFGGTISGSGGIAVLSGDVTLTAADTYTGQTVVNGGADLQLEGQGSIAGSANVTVNGILDVSSATTPQLASLAGSGAVNLGSQTLTLTDGTGVFSGILAGSGGLTVSGGTQTLAGTNSYSGITTVNGGTLAVTGSIASSAGVVVNSGGTLAGSGGTVPAVTVNNGGAVQAGVNGGGTLNINGSVSYATNANTVISVTSASAGKIAVSGAESLAGTLSIASTDKTYPLGQELTVLTASGGVSGAFTLAPVPSTGADFTDTVTYDANDVYLEIKLAKLSPLLPSAATRNAVDSVGGIDAAIAAGDTLPQAFESLGNGSSATLETYANNFASQIGAEVPQAGRSVFDPFLSAIFNHLADVRPSSTPSKPMPLDGEVWFSGIGGSDLTVGQPDTVGTNKFRSNAVGFATGADWDISPSLKLGGAISGALSNFQVAAADSAGRIEAFQASVYGLKRFGTHLYNAFAGGLAVDKISTDRVLTTSETDDLVGRFDGLLAGGRYEAGVDVGWIVPYAALADDFFYAPKYSENAASGAPTFGLTYEEHNTNNPSLELGFRQYADLGTKAWTARVTDQIAWIYDMSGIPRADTGFSALPSSTFTSFGAPLPHDGALLSLGLAWQNRHGLSFDINFNSVLSDTSQSYTGTAGINYSW